MVSSINLHWICPETSAVGTGGQQWSAVSTEGIIEGKLLHRCTPVLFIDDAIKQLCAAKGSLQVLNFVQSCLSVAAFLDVLVLASTWKATNFCLVVLHAKLLLHVLYCHFVLEIKKILIICWCIQHPVFEWNGRWDFFCPNRLFQKSHGTAKHSENSELHVWSFGGLCWYDPLHQWRYTITGGF